MYSCISRNIYTKCNLLFFTYILYFNPISHKKLVSIYTDFLCFFLKPQKRLTFIYSYISNILLSSYNSLLKNFRLPFLKYKTVKITGCLYERMKKQLYQIQMLLLILVKSVYANQIPPLPPLSYPPMITFVVFPVTHCLLVNFQ